MVGGLLFSMALTAFLTGVTEPIEYTFMFLAPALYAIHAVLTGLSLAICSALGIHLGFTFSAGAIDYVLNYGLSQRGCNGALEARIILHGNQVGVVLAEARQHARVHLAIEIVHHE